MQKPQSDEAQFLEHILTRLDNWREEWRFHAALQTGLLVGLFVVLLLK